MTAEVQLRAAQLASEEALLFADLVQPDLRAPLKRRMRLRHEARHGHRERRVRAVLQRGAAAPVSEVGDSLQVVLRLGRQPDHEVHLQRSPTTREQLADHGDQHFFVDDLVDHAAHAVRASFGGDGEARFSHATDLVHDRRRQALEAHRRRRDRRPRRLVLVHQRQQQRLDAVVVAERKRQQGVLRAARAREAFAHELADGLRRPLALGAIDVTGLAESATAHAAALNFDTVTVVHDLGVWHEVVGEVRRLVEVHQQPLAHDRRGAVLRHDRGDGPVLVVVHVVEAGNVDALDARKTNPQVESALPFVLRLDHRVDDFSDQLFGVAEADGVHHDGDRLGIESGRAAADDHGVVDRAVLGANRDATEVDDVDQVRV